MKTLIVHVSRSEGVANLCDGTARGHALYPYGQRLACGGGKKGQPGCKTVHKKITCKKCLKMIKRKP